MPLDLATLGPKPDTTPDANAFGSQSRLNLVFGAAAVAAHHYDARHKPVSYTHLTLPTIYSV